MPFGNIYLHSWFMNLLWLLTIKRYNYYEIESSTLRLSVCLIDCPKTSEKKTFDEEVNEILLFFSIVRLRNIICNSNFEGVKNTQNILLSMIIELLEPWKRILPFKLFPPKFFKSFSEKDFTFRKDSRWEKIHQNEII